MLASYLLWKSIQSRHPTQPIKQEFCYMQPTKEEIQFSNEMICRVCTSPADILITDKIDNMDILSAIRMVANVRMGSADGCPKYICKICFEELKIALAFKKKCESSDWQFGLSTTTETSFARTPSMVFHDFALIIQQIQQKNYSFKKNLLPAQCNLKRPCKFKKICKELRKSATISSDTETSDDDDTFLDESPLEEGEIRRKKRSKVKKKKEIIVPKRYQCRRCSAAFDTKEQLLEHRIQRTCKCLPCPICGKLVANLLQHKKTIHLRTEKFTCHVCGRVFYAAGGLRAHLTVHSDKYDYSCSLCPYKGKQKEYLKMHMRVHTGEKPYLCSECPLKFVSKSNLRKHQLIHGSKKFECSKCKRRFRIESSLKEHYDAEHLNVRYRCSICGRELTSRKKLLRHEIRVHKREKHKLFDEVHKVIVNNENDQQI